MTTDYISEVFGAEGLFASRFPNYESREGQVSLARVIDEGMRTGRHVLGEGACGVGKSLAYAVPAIWHAHHHQKRVVIATANIALQEQLIGKDLPLLSQVLPWAFTFALQKGRNNYVCLERVRRSKEQQAFDRLPTVGEGQQVDEVLGWLDRTTSGDVSELPFIPSPQLWSMVSVGSEECTGNHCSEVSRCFSMRASELAEQADVVVTNYHLLFAHLAVKQLAGVSTVLPPFDLLVCDEAHELAQIARDFFGFTLSEFTFMRLAKAADDLGDPRQGTLIRLEARKHFAKLAAFARCQPNQKRLREPGVVSGAAMQQALWPLIAAASAQAADESLDRELRARARNVARAAGRAGKQLQEALSLGDPDKVYWLELDSKGRAQLCAKPVDVSKLLASELFGCCSSATLVSATMTTAGTFDFVRREVGAPSSALEVVADSPFDFDKQALFVIPDSLPEPSDRDFASAAANVMRQVIEACDGRTLGLFTSYKNLNAVGDHLTGLPHRLLRQGELPRGELTRIFKEDIASVLLGTLSFWTGIDVPGEALTAVVIDKLPFPRPDDPVIEAMCERDPRAFHNYMLPRAIITFRQGVGRLIRSKSDVGVVVVLDLRIIDKSYGSHFIASVPAMLETRDVEDISLFLRSRRYARAS